jgi:hypothetical protein
MTEVHLHYLQLEHSYTHTHTHTHTQKDVESVINIQEYTELYSVKNYKHFRHSYS